MRRLPIILGMVIGYALGVWAQGPIPPNQGPIITGGGGTATASNCCLGTPLNYTNGVKAVPSADGTTAWTFTKADGSTAVVTIDTTNKDVTLGRGLNVNNSFAVTSTFNALLYNTGLFGWVSTSSVGISGANLDTALGRNAAGVVEANTGTLGTFADFIAKRELMPKGSAGGTATAPGATNLRLEVACGSSSGTAALIVYAGTSTVALTVTNNIGSGVTGC